MAEKVPGWLERILLPQLSEIKGQVLELRGEIKGVEGRIEGVDGRIEAIEGRMEGGFAAVRSDLRRLEDRMTTEFARVDQRMDGLDKKLEYGEKISSLENRLAMLEARKAA